MVCALRACRVCCVCRVCVRVCAPEIVCMLLLLNDMICYECAVFCDLHFVWMCRMCMYLNLILFSLTLCAPLARAFSPHTHTHTHTLCSSVPLCLTLSLNPSTLVYHFPSLPLFLLSVTSTSTTVQHVFPATAASECWRSNCPCGMTPRMGLGSSSTTWPET